MWRIGDAGRRRGRIAYDGGMSNLQRIVLLAIASVLAGCAADRGTEPPAERAASLKTENVVVLVLDGERWSETWGDAARANIPERSRLADAGVVCTNFRNDGRTVTLCGHTALCTGFYQDMANDGTERPAHPSFMQRWRAATGAPADQAWVITAKGKLEVLADCTDPAWQGRANPATDCGHSDRETVEIIKRTLSEHHPRLMVVNLKDPDARGHAEDWPGYLAAIRASDGYVGEVWRHLQADPFYRDRTALFVTNDHGRHLDGVKDGFKNHGDDCEGCRHIQLLAIGPDFAAGLVSDEPAGQIDLAVTIADMLGLAIPASEGRVMSELFAKPGEAGAVAGTVAASGGG